MTETEKSDGLLGLLARRFCLAEVTKWEAYRRHITRSPVSCDTPEYKFFVAAQEEAQRLFKIWKEAEGLS